MVDFHSHILPDIDDGSRSVSESLELLKRLKEQGADIVCATPHFMASQTTPEQFILKRQESFEKLKPSLLAETPKIKLGAEVMYYSGISRLKGLESLCLESTRLLLLEMPYKHWGSSIINELLQLCCLSDFQIVLAHFERYLPYQNQKTIEKLLENDILLQSNASFFINLKTRQKAVGLLKKGKIHLLGSDCHDTSSRPPRLDRAEEIIARRLGKPFIEEFNLNAMRLMEDLV